MHLTPKTDTIYGQKEFLAYAQGVINKLGGVTLDGTKWTPSTIVKAGSALIINTASGKAEPYVDGTILTGNVFVLAHDVLMPASGDAQAGALETGYLKKSVVQSANVTAQCTTEFLGKANNRYHLR